MKKFITTIFLLTFVITGKAQFFSFGFPDEFFGPSEPTYEEAEYDGTESEMEAFMKANFQNPANQRDVNGNIVITCIINDAGEVVETQVSRGLRTAFDREAKRVAALMKFKPVNNGNAQPENDDNKPQEDNSGTRPRQRDNNSDSAFSSGNSNQDNSYSNGEFSSGSSNNRYRGNNRNNRRGSNRIFNVTFPIKNGRLNFLNLNTIDV